MTCIARMKVTFNVVREIGLALPDVEEGTIYGSPALKVRGNLLTCMAVHRSAEPESLAVRVDFDHRAGLLTEAPETYYLTGHYRNYPVVLVRLSSIRVDQLRDLLGSAWRFVTSIENRRASRLSSKGNLRTIKRKFKKPRKM